MRLGLGVFQSASGPTSISIISDYFPIKTRTVAVSLASFSIDLSDASNGVIFFLFKHRVRIRWRRVYLYTGISGVCVAALVLLIKEPK